MKRTLPITILRDASVFCGGDDDDDGTAPGDDDDTNGGPDAEAYAPAPDPFDSVADVAEPAADATTSSSTAGTNVDDAPAVIHSGSGWASSSSSSSSSNSSSDTHPVAHIPYVASQGEDDTKDSGLYSRVDGAGRNLLYDGQVNRIYVTPHANTMRPPHIPREVWIRMSKKKRHEAAADFKAESAPAAPVRTRRTHTPPNRSCGKVAAFLCSLVALMGGGSGEDFCDLTPESGYEHISGSDVGDVYEPNVTNSSTNHSTNSPDPNDVY